MLKPDKFTFNNPENPFVHVEISKNVVRVVAYDQAVNVPYTLISWLIRALISGKVGIASLEEEEPD